MSNKQETALFGLLEATLYYPNLQRMSYIDLNSI
jgi:hypothetical protein